MRRTFNRSSPEPLSPLHMSLDLELNLPCGSTQGGRKYHAGGHHHHMNNTNQHGSSGCLSSTVVAAAAAHHHLSLSFGDHDRLRMNPVVSVENGTHDHDHDHGWEDQREMVAAVCKKCHMLVMMFKASPACPNCKFMHPLDHSPPNLFKRGGGLPRSCVSLWN